MATEILMPALSPTMEEGTLAKWLVKEGDAISSGMILAEIETDKATMEFEAVDEGVMGPVSIWAPTWVPTVTPWAGILASVSTVTCVCMDDICSGMAQARRHNAAAWHRQYDGMLSALECSIQA
ncbi:MAG: biotin/lipoyl-containing protein, partial [Pseudomonadota bacterium]